MTEPEPNPKTAEERKKEFIERARKEAEMFQKADKDVGLCYAGGWTYINNLDGVEDFIRERIADKHIPKEFAVGYKVKIVGIQGDKVVVTSNRKAGKTKDGYWDVKINMSNLQCLYDLRSEMEKRGMDASAFPKAPKDLPPKERKEEKDDDEQMREDMKKGLEKKEEEKEPPKEEIAPPEPPKKEEPKVLTQVRLLKSIDATNTAGTILPFVGDIGSHILVKTEGYTNPIRLEKSDEGKSWEWVRETTPPAPPKEGEVPPPPTPPKEKKEVVIEKPWQIVDALERKTGEREKRLQRIRDLANPLLKVKNIYNVLYDNFVWYKELDEDVFMSVWLIPGASLVLKGVPGTGKTQLIEMAVQLFANDVWVVPEEARKIKKGAGNYDALEKKEIMDAWLMERGVLALAKHNQDKEIQDVFFYTDIAIEKFIRNEQEKQKNPLYNPFDEDEWDIYENPPPEHLKHLFMGDPNSVDRYSIKPIPRPIVKAMIKFHNEANRMNANVADVLLGMMSEGEVEYLGEKFNSPFAWDDKKQSLDPYRKGASISFFDYNPHLEVDNPNMELERALLDRITAGFYLSGGSTAMRFEVMDKGTKGIKKPSQQVFEMIKAHTVEPITRVELERIWRLNGKKEGAVPIDAEVVSWIAWMTNLPNLTNRQYSGAYLDETMSGKPIDRTLTTFKSALEGLTEIVRGSGNIADNTPGGIQMAVDQMERPLGVRSAESLLSLYRAFTLLHAYTGETPKPAEDIHIYVKTDADRERIFGELCSLLPYVLDHRINLGVTDVIKSSFLSTFDFIQYYIVPRYKEDTDETPRKRVLFSVMDALMAVYVKNHNLESKGKKKMTDDEREAYFVRVLESKLAERGVSVDRFVEMKKEALVFTLTDLLTAM